MILCTGKLINTILWVQDISLLVKGRGYYAIIRSVLLSGCETWPLRQEDVHRLKLFDHCSLRQLANVEWSDKVSNRVVQKCVLGGNGSDTLLRIIKLCRLRWIGHLFCMELLRLLHRALFLVLQTRWKKKSRRPTDNVLVCDEVCYCWLEQNVAVAFTWLRPKRLPQLGERILWRLRQRIVSSEEVVVISYQVRLFEYNYLMVLTEISVCLPRWRILFDPF